TRRTPRFGWPAASGWGGQNGGFDGTVQVGGLLKGGGVRTKVVHFCITGKRLFLGRLGVAVRCFPSRDRSASPGPRPISAAKAGMSRCDAFHRTKMGATFPFSPR